MPLFTVRVLWEIFSLESLPCGRMDLCSLIATEILYMYLASIRFSISGQSDRPCHLCCSVCLEIFDFSLNKG